MNKNVLFKHIKSRLKHLHFFHYFIFFLVLVFLTTLVKHQKITLQKQIIEVEITGKEWTNSYSQYEGYRPPIWLVENLKIGDKEYSPDGRVTAEIIDIDYFERFGGNAEVLLKIEIETVDSFSSGRTTYRGQNIEIGDKIEFHFNRKYLLGQITNIFADANSADLTKEIKVAGVYKNIPLYLENQIEVGKQVINPFNGKVYATITGKKSTPSKTYLLTDEKDGLLYLNAVPSLRDIELEVTILVNQRLGQYYFSGHQPIKIGEGIYLFFPEFIIKPLELTHVEEITE